MKNINVLFLVLILSSFSFQSFAQTEYPGQKQVVVKKIKDNKVRHKFLLKPNKNVRIVILENDGPVVVKGKFIYADSTFLYLDNLIIVCGNLKIDSTLNGFSKIPVTGIFSLAFNIPGAGIAIVAGGALLQGLGYLIINSDINDGYIGTGFILGLPMFLLGRLISVVGVLTIPAKVKFRLYDKWKIFLE